jgi:muramidase (phage lysozyme)
MSGFKTPQEYQQFLRGQISTPQANGLFRAIAAPEGTLNSDGSLAYGRQFGGNDLDLSKLGPGHPNQVVRTNGYASAATGFGQFMPATWKGANQALGGNLDFRKPEDQKVAALYLARERTKNIGGLTALKENGLTPEFVAALSPEWASMPTLAGKSYYDQPVKPFDWIKQKYDEGLKAGGSSTEVASSGASPVTGTESTPTTPVTPTSPTITQNDDGSQTVIAPGTQINVTLTDGDKKSNNFLEDYIAKAAWSGLLKDMTGGIDINKIANTKLYPTPEELLA